MLNKNLLIVLGATAVGKTKLATQLAYTYNGEIISADSRQIFKGMDIGTGKDLQDYTIEGKSIPYHLIDILEAGEKYHVNAFKDDFYNVFEQITQKNKLPILCGGTGMYIHSLLQNHQYTGIPVNQPLRDSLINLDKDTLTKHLDKYALKYRAQADYSVSKRLIRAIEIADFLTNNTYEEVKRLPLKPLVIGLYNDVEVRRNKILDRLKQRLANGLIDEVQLLLKNGVTEEMLIFYGLEYKFVVSYLKNEISFDDLYNGLGTAICQFAKRQMTFFRKMEKDGVDINWVSASSDFEEIKRKTFELVECNFELK